MRYLLTVWKPSTVIWHCEYLARPPARQRDSMLSRLSYDNDALQDFLEGQLLCLRCVQRSLGLPLRPILLE